MSLSETDMKAQLEAYISNDPDNLYEPNTSAPKPNLGDPAWDAFATYLMRAVIKEIDDSASIQPGIEVEDSGGTLIGTTRTGQAGVID